MLLPLRYDPAAAIPMKWGAVYMAVFMGFWGLGRLSPTVTVMSTVTPTVTVMSTVTVMFTVTPTVTVVSTVPPTVTAVYMAVFMGFWGLGMPAASFTDTQHFVLDITVNVAL